MTRLSGWVFVVLLILPVLAISAAPAWAQEGEKKVSIDKVPDRVKAAVLEVVGDGRLVDIGEITKGGKKFYEIEMVVDGKEFDVLFSSTGKVLKRTFEGYKTKKGERPVKVEKRPAEKQDSPMSEKKITLDQVPDKVKKAILKAVGNGRLVDVGVFTKGKKKLYEIEMVVDGMEYDVLFSSDGKVVRKTFEGLRAEGKKKASKQADPFQDYFDLENRKLASRGRNRYFILEPGYQLVLEGKEGDHSVQLKVTVLDETRKIGNIVTRVVEERESVDGALIEISRNYFAICKRTRSVFYFGEEVDIYKNGKVIGHEGAWIHGKNKARAGMMMPGEPVIGARYYQEVAPGVAMDRARIADLKTTLETPAGTFRRCLRVQEENPLDREKEFKIHAPGIGLVQDEDLLLVRYGFVNM